MDVQKFYNRINWGCKQNRYSANAAVEVKQMTL